MGLANHCCTQLLLCHCSITPSTTKSGSRPRIKPIFAPSDGAVLVRYTTRPRVRREVSAGVREPLALALQSLPAGLQCPLPRTSTTRPQSLRSFVLGPNDTLWQK